MIMTVTPIVENKIKVQPPDLPAEPFHLIDTALVHDKGAYTIAVKVTGVIHVNSESTMLVQEVTKTTIRASIAREMGLGTKPGGFLLIVDRRYGRRGYQAVTRQCLRSPYIRLRHRSGVGGALIPPVGRAVSAWCPSLYFLIHQWIPPLIGLKADLLCKSFT